MGLLMGVDESRMCIRRVMSQRRRLLQATGRSAKAVPQIGEFGGWLCACYLYTVQYQYTVIVSHLCSNLSIRNSSPSEGESFLCDAEGRPAEAMCAADLQCIVEKVLEAFFDSAVVSEDRVQDFRCLVTAVAQSKGVYRLA